MTIEHASIYTVNVLIYPIYLLYTYFECLSIFSTNFRLSLIFPYFQLYFNQKRRFRRRKLKAN